MYQNGCNCNGGLGLLPELLTTAVDVFGGGGGAGAAGAAPGGSASSSPTVSPQFSTQISPQISPIFQQQFQPTNSAATAGTAMTGAPVSTGVPAGAMPVPYTGAPGYAPAPAVPGVPQTGMDWARYMPYALAGLGILAFVGMKRRGVKRST